MHILDLHAPPGAGRAGGGAEEKTRPQVQAGAVGRAANRALRLSATRREV